MLQSVFIPQYITVHLGKPQNSAANETVSFPYYIKNVCRDVYKRQGYASAISTVVMIVFALIAYAQFKVNNGGET